MRECPLCHSTNVQVLKRSFDHDPDNDAVCMNCGCRAPVPRWNDRLPSGQDVIDQVYAAAERATHTAWSKGEYRLATQIVGIIKPAPAKEPS